jgi:two-component system nitrogen regulation response regulator GlnG
MPAASGFAGAASSGAAARQDGYGSSGVAVVPAPGGEPSGVGAAASAAAGGAAFVGAMTGDGAAAAHDAVLAWRPVGTHPPVPPPTARPGWASLLEAEVAAILSAQSARGGEPPAVSDVMERLTRSFESTIIRTALRHTRGRRIDAALRLGIGRNTITRKIQDLRLEDDD